MGNSQGGFPNTNIHNTYGLKYLEAKLKILSGPIKISTGFSKYLLTLIRSYQNKNTRPYQNIHLRTKSKFPVEVSLSYNVSVFKVKATMFVKRRRKFGPEWCCGASGVVGGAAL